MPDRNLDGQATADALIGLGREPSLIIFRRAGALFYLVVAQTEDDATTYNATDPSKPATREPWQRYNVVLSIGRDLAQTLWNARNRSLPDKGIFLTAWYERASGRYDIGPVAHRSGASGRPSWARRPPNDSPLILPPELD